MTTPDDTIPDRIERILAKRGITARELSIKSGLSPTMLSKVIARLRQDPGAVELNTLLKVAAGAGVSWIWLVTGQLPEDGDASFQPPRFCDLPNWPELRTNAERELTAPAWVWEYVAQSRPIDDAVNLAQVVAFARYVLHHRTKP